MLKIKRKKKFARLYPRRRLDIDRKICYNFFEKSAADLRRFFGLSSALFFVYEEKRFTARKRERKMGGIE